MAAPDLHLYKSAAWRERYLARYEELARDPQDPGQPLPGCAGPWPRVSVA